MPKLAKLPRIKRKSTAAPLVMRCVDIGCKPNLKTVIVATENPVQRYDQARGMVINEVLLMEGVEFRGGRNQIPIVDSHDDRTVRNIFGSVLQLRTEGAELVGETKFASDEESQTIATRMLEGHINDFSITADPLEKIFIPRGQTYTTRGGITVEGPADIITRWVPLNASICATGADEYSTVRRSYTDLNSEVKRMDEALLKQLQALGMPADMTDPNQIGAWIVGRMGGVTEQEEPIENMAEPPVKEEVPAEEPMIEKAEMTAEEKKPDMEEVKSAVERALKADVTRRKEIQASCQKVGIERAFADKLCEEGVSVEIARERILERMASKPIGQSSGAGVRVTESEDDKFYAAVRDGLVSRSFRSAGVRRQAFEGGKPAPGHEDFANMKLSRIAETFCQRLGCDVMRMAPKDIALVAMGQPSALNRYRVQRDAYHSTGSFPNLLLDAANKTLLAGYEEAPYTWEMWARNAGTTSDFKAINRIRFSEMATPEMVPENTEYKEATMSDAKESYTIHKYGSIFTITWETVVNDDLDAISRIPAMQGAACRRKQNQAVYGVLTANATMADGGALFNATAQTSSGGHANLDTGAGAPAVGTLNSAFVKMMTKKGLRSDVILNIQPAFLIVPAALSATALQLLGSIADPSVGGSAAGNSNTKNIYGPNGDRPLRVVVEPVLDGNSATAWYLAANNSQVDTVEVTFLEGEQSPVLENEWDFDKDVYKYKVRQTFGVAAIDYRGLYKHAGA
jgi:hypothetical protein